jgi:hypothetical protein
MTVLSVTRSNNRTWDGGRVVSGSGNTFTWGSGQRVRLTTTHILRQVNERRGLSVAQRILGLISRLTNKEIPVKVSVSNQEERRMSHFVTLIRYTQQGVAKIKESPARLDAAKKAAEKAGGTIHAWYLTHGKVRRRNHLGISQ